MLNKRMRELVPKPLSVFYVIYMETRLRVTLATSLVHQGNPRPFILPFRLNTVLRMRKVPILRTLRKLGLPHVGPSSHIAQYICRVTLCSHNSSSYTIDHPSPEFLSDDVIGRSARPKWRQPITSHQIEAPGALQKAGNGRQRLETLGNG